MVRKKLKVSQLAKVKLQIIVSDLFFLLMMNKYNNFVLLKMVCNAEIKSAVK